jgi:hypothetical protein
MQPVSHPYINWVTYLLMELSPSWGATNFAAIQELPSILLDPKVQYRVHKSHPLVHILSHISPIHKIHPISLRSIFNIAHPSSSWPSQYSLSFWLSTELSQLIKKKTILVYQFSTKEIVTGFWICMTSYNLLTDIDSPEIHQAGSGAELSSVSWEKSACLVIGQQPQIKWVLVVKRPENITDHSLHLISILTMQLNSSMRLHGAAFN